MRLIALCAVSAALLFTLALAQTSPWLLTKEEHASWQAIGRLNQAGYKSHSLCTGTLVAPDVVLTAAHCFDLTRSDPVIFVAGWYRGGYVAARKVSDATIGAEFVLGAPLSMEMISQDWAFLKLESPIETVAPLPMVPWRPGQSYDLVAYSGTTPHSLRGRLGCLNFEAAPGIIQLICGSEPGNSGGPVLGEGDDGWHVVGVVSAVSRSGVTFAVAPNGPLPSSR